MYKYLQIKNDNMDDNLVEQLKELRLDGLYCSADRQLFRKPIKQIITPEIDLNSANGTIVTTNNGKDIYVGKPFLHPVQFFLAELPVMKVIHHPAPFLGQV